jgi:hypothetical protein
MKPRFTVTIADNGWIVRVVNYGDIHIEHNGNTGEWKEKKRPKLIVFREWPALVDWIKCFSQGECP